MQIKLYLRSIAKALFIYPFVSIASLVATMVTFGIILGAALYSLPIRYQDSIIFFIVWIAFTLIVSAFYIFEGEADMQNYRFSIIRHVVSLFTVSALLLAPVIYKWNIDNIPDAALGVFYAPFLWLSNYIFINQPVIPVISIVLINLIIFTFAYILGKIKFVKIRPYYNRFQKNRAKKDKN